MTGSATVRAAPAMLHTPTKRSQLRLHRSGNLVQEFGPEAFVGFDAASLAVIKNGCRMRRQSDTTVRQSLAPFVFSARITQWERWATLGSLGRANHGISAQSLP